MVISKAIGNVNVHDLFEDEPIRRHATRVVKDARLASKKMSVFIIVILEDLLKTRRLEATTGGKGRAPS